MKFKEVAHCYIGCEVILRGYNTSGKLSGMNQHGPLVTHTLNGKVESEFQSSWENIYPVLRPHVDTVIIDKFPWTADHFDLIKSKEAVTHVTAMQIMTGKIEWPERPWSHSEKESINS